MNWIQQIQHHRQSQISQGGQDGIIDFIFKNVPPKNTKPYYVEFGFNNTTGANANTTLLRNNGWEGLLLDGDNSNPELNLHAHYLSSTNVCDLFKQYNVPLEPEYVSIDVDSTDLWLFKAIAKKYKPMLFSVEYNCNFPITDAITFIDDVEASTLRANSNWPRIYGASLKALNMVAEEAGYTLIAIEPVLDAFFIRNDLIEGLEKPPLEDFSEYNYPFMNTHDPNTDKSLIKYFMDYEHFLKTNDVIASIEVAADSSIQHLIK